MKRRWSTTLARQIISRALMALSVSVFGILLSASTQAQSTYEPYSFSTLAGNPPGSTDGASGDARFYYDYGVAGG